MQDIAQDIQSGLYNNCGDPDTNWDSWKKRCSEILNERGIINVMDCRNFINARLIKKSNELYTWQQVCEITNNAGGNIYSSPFGDYDNDKFKLEQININKISKKYYLTINECKEYNMDEDESVITKLSEAFDNGENIPPIILDNNYNVIDGSHRLGMYDYLGINYVKAFILQK